MNYDVTIFSQDNDEGARIRELIADFGLKVEALMATAGGADVIVELSYKEKDPAP